MSSQVDYSAEDWLLLREFPFHLILGAIASDTHGPLGGAARESVIAGRHLVAEGLEKRDNALIAALLCDYASEGEDRTPEIELDSPEQRLSAVTQALSEAIRVRELLAERDDGIEAREFTVLSGGRKPGAAILEEAERLGADLLIKGAYTQSRLRQMIFGGATSHILVNTELPVFMAH